MFGKKIPLIEKVLLESNDSGHVNKDVFDSSKNNNIIQEKLSSTKLDSSESLCVTEKGCLKSEGCNFPRCKYSLSPRSTNEEVKNELLVSCIRCMRRYHHNYLHPEDIKPFLNVINDNFVDDTYLCYDCCLEFFELKFHSSTGRPQRISVCNRIYATTRKTVSFFNVVWYVIKFPCV